MNDQPFLKFFHRDWLADSALRMCSRAARGLWIDMLSLMADAEEFGVLPFGVNDAPEALSNACGGSPKEIETLLRELGRRGVYSVREDGYIFSRRLVRDHQKFIVMSRLGKNGARSRYNENSDSAIAENADTAITKSNEAAIAESEDSGIAHIHRISEAQNNRNEERGGEAAASPRRMVKPDLPDVPECAFEALESDVARFIANAAAENATGKISLGRIQSLRRALLAAREEFPTAFADALRESNARGKPSIGYLRAVAKHHEPPVRHVEPDEPEPDYILAAIALHDRDFGGAA